VPQTSPPRSKKKEGSVEQAYKPADMKKLSEIYSPEQMAAIEAGEKIISGEDLSNTSERVDPWSPNYFDDLSMVDPFVDRPVRAPWHTADETPRMKTEEEFDAELAQVTQDMPPEMDSQDEVWENYLKNLRVTVGGDNEGMGRSAAAPEAPAKIKKINEKQREVRGEASPALVRLMQMTGYSLKEISALRVKSIISHAVVNQTRLGKIRKSYFLSVAGNGNGRIGIGEGKAEEGSEALLQSQYRAIRNMQPILRYEKRTIFGEVHGKVSATELELYARPPGNSKAIFQKMHTSANISCRLRSPLPAIHLGSVQMRRHI
jgi:small subunit ribosomal protein S5